MNRNQKVQSLMSQYDTLTKEERDVMYQRLVLNKKWTEIGIREQRVIQLREGAFKKLDLSVLEERRRSQWIYVAYFDAKKLERKAKREKINICQEYQPLLCQYETLTEGERNVMYQRLVLNKKWSEIGRNIGISKQVVSLRKDKAFKKLDLSVVEERRRSQWIYIACHYPGEEERKRRKIYQANRKKLMEKKASEKTMTHERQYGMGEVVHILSSEYRAGIQASTIRFWEQEQLLEPTRKGTHRRYTESDIGWIRFIKELSLSGMPINQMQQRVKETKTSLKTQKHTIGYYANISKEVNILDVELRLLYGLTKQERKKKIYDFQSLIHILRINKARMIIEKIETYGLVVPELTEGIKRCSPYEKMILHILSFLEFLDPGMIEKCKIIPHTIKEFSKMGIRDTLVEDRKHGHNFGYNAILYNLVFRNLEALGLLADTND